MRTHALLSALLLLVVSSVAWPSEWKPLDLARREVAPLLARKPAGDDSSSSSSDNDKSTSSASGSSQASSSGSSSDAKTTSDSKSSSKDQSSSITSGGKSSSAKSTAKSTGSSSSKYETTKTFDDRLGAGGVSMVTPNTVTDPTTYYKISDYVTFAWNFTSLSITPSAVDVLASCSVNSATYTIATNLTIPTHGIQSVVWDTNTTNASSLVTEEYTLIIYDASKDVSATAQAGYLGTYNQFYFGMYQPQAYTPLADWVCATCNGAIGPMEKQTLGFIVGMATLTVLSFSWFGGVAGLW